MSDERFRAAVDPYLDDFEEVLRVVELSSGFVLLPIVVPGPDLARMLAKWLLAKHRSTLVMEPESADDWKNLASLLLKHKPEQDGVVLVVAGGDVPEDLSLPLRLVNERRDAIAKHLDCPLLWCGSSAFLVQTGQQAPDFWSVRAVERRIEALKKPDSRQIARRMEAAKDDLLDEAMKQGDRKSSEIMFVSHLRKAMEGATDDEFDQVMSIIPKEFVEADRKFAFEVGLMRAEMDRRRGNVGDALKMLEALEEKIKKPEDKCRLEHLRGRIWERAGDTAQAKKAYDSACSSAPTTTHDLVAHLYVAALRARHASKVIPDLMHWREVVKSKTESISLDALGAAFLAEAAARHHDLRRAERLLQEAIALHEESKEKEERTILFGGEVAEAIRNAKAVIERAQESSVKIAEIPGPGAVAIGPIEVRVEKKAPIKHEPANNAPTTSLSLFRSKIVFGFLVGFALGLGLVYIVSRPFSGYCFVHNDKEIICAKSLEQCEKRRNASAAAGAVSPCYRASTEISTEKY